MGCTQQGRYFCRPGYYMQPLGMRKSNHSTLIYFDTLDELTAHRMLHALDGAMLEGEVDNMIGVD